MNTKVEKDKKDAKSINVESVVSYLNFTFARKAEEVFPLQKAVKVKGKGTDLYNAQVEHCYNIDEIQRGPSYMLPKAISDANDYIASLDQYKQDASNA